ncbi:MAG: excinuclease ABC subunit UvrB [Elusimicrobia bacterium]|nr:excinuclease ABC subunit UvrB [Elusimicrobiota bacterium]
MKSIYKLKSPFKPAGDQPAAIKRLSEGLNEGRRHQVLLGVTGSGKTLTMAHSIAAWNRPALVISHNKVLAAQLYAELKSFFPQNAIEYFISYYDYYQPEAYVPQSDTYIEKDAAINEHIERLRLKATASLLARQDVIVVASVSCIYNIGDPEDFKSQSLFIQEGDGHDRETLMAALIRLHYERNDVAMEPGKFRPRGRFLEIFPPYLEHPLRLTFEGGSLGRIEHFHEVSGDVLGRLQEHCLYPGRHFVTPAERMKPALDAIRQEMEERLAELRSQGKLLEAQRLETRTKYDLAMMRSLGFCSGIENYSRHLAFRAPGERPYCLIDYFPKDYLLLIDESHATLPQVRGMYEGDRSRKSVLVEHGFRLPSALDNRPLKFDEFETLMGPAVYVSATPGPYELTRAKEAIAEQIVRPTGLVDPPVEIHPIEGQMNHLIGRLGECVKRGERALVTTLTKRMAEDLNVYLAQKELRVRYLHSDIESLERIKIIKDLRLGNFDILVGVNLLREGLDLPEVSLVAVLDADKEGFLRSETTLIQIAGRAARNINGFVVLYADRITGSMKRALDEMSRRRRLQLSYNKSHHITPRSVVKEIHELEEFEAKAKTGAAALVREAYQSPDKRESIPALLKEIEREMKEAADRLDFEAATVLRDQLFELKAMAPRSSKKLRD